MSDEITIITNNVPRLILDGYDLSVKEREYFDYLDWSKIEKGEESASFFSYKGEIYDLGEFLTTYGPWPVRNPFEGWDGYQSHTFSSGMLVRYCEDHDHVVVGRYF